MADLIPHPDGSQEPAPGSFILASQNAGVVSAAEGETKFLYTFGLNTCMGIAVSGAYPIPKPADATEERHDRFMIHIDESEPATKYDELETEVKKAQAQGLTDLHVYFAAPDPVSFRREGEAVVQEVRGLQQYLMMRFRILVGSDPSFDHQPAIHWYPYQAPETLDGCNMALFGDRRVVVEREEQDFASYKRWPIVEQQWANVAVVSAAALAAKVSQLAVASGKKPNGAQVSKSQKKKH
ncbi:hypothetical protein PG991_010753 [Apiospora marii]|uniref:Uncharacterized protein n=1 Tax=Apiospora marii TaxID=335849 RepID=A0ABR1RC54_9PEZI